MKGILFKPWKIKAIAARHDKEWQTRRGITFKSFPNIVYSDWACPFAVDGGWKFTARFGMATRQQTVKPRYQVGEVVYIKEGFTYVTLAEKDPWKGRAMKDGSFRRKPDGSPVTMCYKLDGYEIGSDWLNPRGMPAWAARYFIKITGVEACRTKDISFDDCLAEGVVDCPFWQNLDYKAPAPLHPENLTNAEADKEIGRGWIEYARQAYFALYDSINGKGAHERNWDWKYSFIPHSPDIRKGAKE